MQTSTLSSREKWTLTVSCLTVALVIGSMAALYTSLGEIAVESGASQTELTWIVDGYTLALACLLLPAGAVGDRYGRRAVLIAGLVVFAAASLVPLVASDPVWLIASRVVAGSGAALMMPSTLSIMTATFPAARRSQAVGVWAGVAGCGAIVGMLGSGALLQLWSWQSIFVGFAVAALILLPAAWTLPESRQAISGRFDTVGSAAIVLAVGLTVIALIEGPVRGWDDSMTLMCIIGAAVATGVFIAAEVRSPHPLLDLHLFTDRHFGGGALAVGLQFVVLFGLALLTVQYVQLILGYGAWQSALAIAPIGVPLVVFSAITPWLAPRVGLRVMAVLGFLLVAGGLYLASRLTVESAYQELMWALLLTGAGMGLTMAPATTAIMTATPEDHHGVAAAVNDASREIGAAIGIAIAGSVLAAGYSQGIGAMLERVPEPARDATADSPAAAMQAATTMDPETGHAVGTAVQAAFIDGYADASLILALITVASSLLLAMWIPERGNRRNQEAPEPAVL